MCICRETCANIYIIPCMNQLSLLLVYFVPELFLNNLLYTIVDSFPRQCSCE